MTFMTTTLSAIVTYMTTLAPTSIFTILAYGLWGICFAYWIIAAFHTKRTKSIPKRGEQIVATVLIAIGFTLVFYRHVIPVPFGAQLFTPGPLIGMLGVLLTLLGVTWALLAREALGVNWSGAVVTIKEDHQLIESGPYAYVRHPIYAGFLLGALGTVFTIGTLASFCAIPILLIAFAIRIRREEKMMLAQFPDTFRAYKFRTKMLIPRLF